LAHLDANAELLQELPRYARGNDLRADTGDKHRTQFTTGQDAIMANKMDAMGEHTDKGAWTGKG